MVAVELYHVAMLVSHPNTEDKNCTVGVVRGSWTSAAAAAAASLSLSAAAVAFAVALAAAAAAWPASAVVAAAVGAAGASAAVAAAVVAAWHSCNRRHPALLHQSVAPSGCSQIYHQHPCWWFPPCQSLSHADQRRPPTRTCQHTTHACVTHMCHSQVSFTHVTHTCHLRGSLTCVTYAYHTCQLPVSRISATQVTHTTPTCQDYTAD